MIDNSFLLVKKKISRSTYCDDFLYLDESSKFKVTNPISLVERVLISRLKVGDSSAFSSIFTAYYKDLVIFASRFTNDLSIAEEIVQDIFVKLWEEHESITISISLKSYLLKIVQNKYIDWYRHRRIMQTHKSFIMESSPVFENDTDNYILYSELQEQIDAALIKLPEEISEAFRLSRYKGLKYNEIATIMNVSVRTIEVRIGKALNMLRKSLIDYLILIVVLFSFLF